MTLDCGCVVANGRLEEPCPEHIQRTRLTVVKPGTPGYNSALPAGTVFVEHDGGSTFLKVEHPDG